MVPVSSGVSCNFVLLTRDGGRSTERLKAGDTGVDDGANILLYVDPDPVYFRKRKKKQCWGLFSPKLN